MGAQQNGAMRIDSSYDRNRAESTRPPARRWALYAGVALLAAVLGITFGAPFRAPESADTSIVQPVVTPVEVTPPSFPLGISENGHWIEDAAGRPFLVNGEAGWSLFAELDRAEATLYLEDRAAKGVNLVMASLIEHAFTDQTPPYRNANGDPPFTDTLVAGEQDFSAPKEAYWSHVDWIIREADRLGIVILALPAYVGYRHSRQGWAAAIAANGPGRMASYGRFLGDRYSDFENIIWCMGGDGDVVFRDSDLGAEINALATGIGTNDTTHLMTAHAQVRSARDGGYDQPWLDFDTAYPDDLSDLHDDVRSAWQRKPAMPVLMIEADYGNEHSMTDLMLRKQIWQAVLGGAIGHVYGNSPTWYFGVNADHPGDGFADVRGLDWRDRLDDFGASFLPYVRKLQEGRDLSRLTPDYQHRYVTEGYGSGADYAPALASPEILVAYTPGRPLRLDASRFVDARFNVRWYDVRNGGAHRLGTMALGSGSVQLTPPDSNDWVLLIDDARLGLDWP